jgi:hypothetical protein
MLSIMLGDERALRDAAANWLELLVALLFWRYTDASPQLHLAQLLGSCAEQMAAAAKAVAAAGGAPEDENGPFLAFLRELLVLGSQLEVQGVVRLATNSEFCGLWFVAHVYDVLRGYPRAEAVFSRPLPHLGCDQVQTMGGGARKENCTGAGRTCQLLVCHTRLHGVQQPSAAVTPHCTPPHLHPHPSPSLPPRPRCTRSTTSRPSWPMTARGRSQRSTWRGAPSTGQTQWRPSFRGFR